VRVETGTVAAGAFAGDGYSKTTISTYRNDWENWLVGPLARAEVTSVAPN
jgi:hypothetical protein